MSVPVSFTHVLNPFPAREGSEHSIASRVTWASLQVALQTSMKAGLKVDWKAVILPGDEAAVDPSVQSTVYLTRTVQDVAKLMPRRPLPLIGDILQLGASDIDSTHLIFSNMDIAVLPHFYIAAHEAASRTFGPEVPFTIARTNVDSSLAHEPLHVLYEAQGSAGHGYDCFVMPRSLLSRLDLGNCCIGAPHFDLLLFAELDMFSGRRARHIDDQHLTFHLGNDIAWAAMIDYVEHNLNECLAAIERIRSTHQVTPGSILDRYARHHFAANATLASSLLRRAKRIPGFGSLVHQVKRAMGRQY